MKHVSRSSLLGLVFTTSLTTLLLSAFTASPAFALKKTGPRSVRIRVLSYNVKGLPALINPQYDSSRYADIGRILAARKRVGNAPDIVMAQEAFDAKTADIQAGAQYPFEAYGPSSTKLLNSGLFILSDFKITAKGSILYAAGDCGTWDCFAAKGAQAVRVTIPGVPFLLTIVNTHTQSGRDYEVAREAQLQDFAAFVNRILQPGVAAIVGGDINTRPSQDTFVNFERASGLTSVGRVCTAPNTGCVVAPGTRPADVLEETVDHLFIAPGTSLRVKPLVIGRTFEKPFGGRMLSDHTGYETIYELSW